VELKPGYKQTDLGVIPKEWKVKPCSEISTLITVGIVIRPTQYYVPQGVPAFRSANIREDGLDISNLVFISHRANTQLVKSQVRAGDVLTVRTGYPGISIVVPPEFAGSNCIDILITRPSKALSSEYLAAWINSPSGKGQVLRSQGGLAQQHFNVRDLRHLLVALPDLPEQRAIASALADVDALLGALTKIIDKKRDLKKAAMQQLLTGQKRLPGFSGDWKLKTLGELGEISGAGVDKKIRPGEIPVRLVNYLDVYRRGFIYSKDLSHFVSAPTEQAARCSVRKGDVFFTPSSEVPYDIAVSAVAMEDIPDAVYSYHLVRLRLFEDWDLSYRGYAFKSRQFFIQAERTCEGSGVRYVITLPRFRQLLVLVPPTLEEQAAIGAVLRDVDLEIDSLVQRREKTRSLKHGIIQELLTGRTRLV
jgi:type I restriction enzyme S subunit